MQSITSSINEKLKDMRFRLHFNFNESSFKVEDRLSQNRMDEAAIMVGESSGIYYVNNKLKEKLHQVEAFGKLFLIKTNLHDVKWVLKNQSKKIGEFSCYKATTTKTENNDKGTFTKKVIAWYTPDIPINSGPVGYVSLPGLIIELNIENEVKFYLTEIEYK